MHDAQVLFLSLLFKGSLSTSVWKNVSVGFLNNANHKFNGDGGRQLQTDNYPV